MENIVVVVAVGGSTHILGTFDENTLFWGAVQYFELAALVNWAGTSGWPHAWADLADFLRCSLAAPAAGCFCLPRLLLAAHQVPLAAECPRMLHCLNKKTPISGESNQKCDTIHKKQTCIPEAPLAWSAGSWHYGKHSCCCCCCGRQYTHFEHF